MFSFQTVALKPRISKNAKERVYFIADNNDSRGLVRSSLKMCFYFIFLLACLDCFPFKLGENRKLLSNDFLFFYFPFLFFVFVLFL
jgi:hypothetical protein